MTKTRVKRVPVSADSTENMQQVTASQLDMHISIPSQKPLRLKPRVKSSINKVSIKKKLEKPHALIQQPPSSDWCALTSCANACDSFEEGLKLVGVKRKLDSLLESDFKTARQRLEEEIGVNIKKNGIGPGDLWEYFTNYEGKTLGLDKWVFKRRDNAHYLNLLIPDEQKAGRSYIIFGRTTSDSKLRNKSADCILGRRRIGKKVFSMTVPTREPFKCRHTLDAARELMREWEDRCLKPRGFGPGGSQPHAMCIKFNQHGIPFRFDPGKKIVHFWLVFFNVDV